MRCFSLMAMTSTAVLLIAVASAAMAEGPPPDLFNPQIEVEYVQPDAEKHPEFIPIYQRLKDRKALELFRQFLAPLKFKEGQKLILKLDQCGGRYAHYIRQTPAVVTICYEFDQEIVRLAPTTTVQLVQTQGHPAVHADAARIGPFALEVLHGVALATFDLLDIPVWGRKDDAADRVAALVMLQFSKFNHGLDGGRRHRMVPGGRDGGNRRPFERARDHGATLLHDALHRRWCGSEDLRKLRR